MRRNIKKIGALAVLLALAALPWAGCRRTAASNSGRAAMGEVSAHVSILTKAEGRFLSERIAFYLEDAGITARICEEPSAGADAVVCVGDGWQEYEALGAVMCSADLQDPSEPKGEGMVCPYLSSGNMARAAMLLLPEARHFFIISRSEGAADVQAACDIFDAAGVDYTVELLGDRSAGEAVLSSAKRGADAVILPFFAPDAGAMSPSELGTGLITVGLDGAVEGALATFCPDIEAIAKRAADEAALAVNGEGAAKRNESLVCLRIDPRIAEALSADVTAVEEDYKTAYMCEG